VDGLHPWGSRNDDLNMRTSSSSIDPDESLAWPAGDEGSRESSGTIEAWAGFVKTTGVGSARCRADRTGAWWPEGGVRASIVTDMEQAAPSRYLTKMTNPARERIFWTISE
jgi:DNA primase